MEDWVKKSSMIYFKLFLKHKEKFEREQFIKEKKNFEKRNYIMKFRHCTYCTELRQ
jgi:hypothetical protein